jgi:magnesium transporter
MITVYRWKAKGGGTWQGAEALATPRAEGEVVWVDLEEPSPEEERQVLEGFLPVHPLTLEDVTRPRRAPDQPPHFPKVEEFPDYLFVVVNPLSLSVADWLAERMKVGEVRLTTQLSAVLTRQVLVTHHYEPLVSVAHLRAYLQRHESQAERGPDFLFQIVLDLMVDQYAPLLDAIDDTVDEVEEEVFTRPAPGC